MVLRRANSLVQGLGFHHSIYLWFICFPWWSIDELETLHADRTTVCFEPWQKPRARLRSRKTGLSPLPSILILTVPRRYFCCCSLLLLVLAMLVTYFVNFRYLNDHILGKSCSFGFPRVPLVNCCQFRYLVISLMLLRAGCGIWLYQFLIIAYFFLLSIFHTLGPRLLSFLNRGQRCLVNSRWSPSVTEQRGRGSSIGNVPAWDATGPEFDPHVRHILSWRLGHKKILLPFSCFRWFKMSNCQLLVKDCALSTS